MLNRIFNLRLWSLFVKEFHQIRRNRRLVVLLIIPPTLNIILFGLALNPDFENLRLGVVDYSRTPESRELVSAFAEALVFRVNAYYASPDEMGRAISKGELNAGLVIPRDFAEKRARRETAGVQLLVDAVNANTATIAGGYAARIIASLNQKLVISKVHVAVTPHATLLYNPGLNSAAARDCHRAFDVALQSRSRELLVYYDRDNWTVAGAAGIGCVLRFARPRKGDRHDRATTHVARWEFRDYHRKSCADLSSASSRYWPGACGGAACLRRADAWQPFVVFLFRFAVRALRHRHGNDDRDFHTHATAGATDDLLHQPTASHSFGRDHAD